MFEDILLVGNGCSILLLALLANFDRNSLCALSFVLGVKSDSKIAFSFWTLEFVPGDVGVRILFCEGIVGF